MPQENIRAAYLSSMAKASDFAGYLKSKHFEKWIGGYTRHYLANLNPPPVRGPRHILFAFCDHYEPLWGHASEEIGRCRVDAWADTYPKLLGEFRDADGFAPRHSYFFPGEQYSPYYLDRLGELAKAGLGEVEFHLHHQDDTADKLRADILGYLKSFAEHGHLSRDSNDKLRYAFIHGNWCLANARADGTFCGVDDEIPLLFDTGCYADFTFPSDPEESQPNIVNQIYWPTGDLHRRRAYENGKRARVGEIMRDRILMIEGPLALALRANKQPIYIESSHVTGVDPANLMRIKSWLGQNIHIQGRPEWVFVKVHTHGAPEKNADSLLAGDGRRLHELLTEQYNDGENWVLHYVTAREMFNIAAAAMEGHAGNPGEFRNYQLPPPPIAT
jgi:hypothetical protein